MKTTISWDMALRSVRVANFWEKSGAFAFKEEKYLQ
jgi:hypothetical protein